ncbi:MAG: oxidoreductase [Burkholderiales bacterium]|jgi:3-oxoacyl-[acyl-carrier protein] reductase|nr:oxidoreductase [Burkholderiales bacterium]
MKVATKVAIVTGGSSGLGKAAVDELSRRGWQVAAMARRNVEFAGDVTNDADCRRVAKAVLAKWGRLDALVNSAGTTKFVAHSDLEGLSADDILGIFRVNVVGPFQMIRACAEALRQSRGCVVNISSISSLLGTGSSIAYAASKSALDTMSIALSRALGPEVRVNVVAPGYVKTPWQVAAHGAQGADELERRYAERAPLKAAAEPQDIADAIAWLCEGARRVTGEIIYVDGGMHVAPPR